MLKFVEIATGNQPNASVIWLHGLGADGHDFAGIIPQLNLPSSIAIRFIFPHAPLMPVTLNGGMRMPAWFDIYGLNLGSKQDEQGILKAYAWITELIEAEHQRGIAYNRIALAGFSQGGALALITGLSFSQPLAGIIALSTYLPLTPALKTQVKKENTHIPVFIAHGLYDPIVPVTFGQASQAALQKLNYQAVEWHTYPMQHQICGEEINDISAWLQQNLA